MQRHIRAIADLLKELADPDIQTDAVSTASIMQAVHKQSEAACAFAAEVKQKFEAISAELQTIEARYGKIAKNTDDRWLWMSSTGTIASCGVIAVALHPAVEAWLKCIFSALDGGGCALVVLVVSPFACWIKTAWAKALEIHAVSKAAGETREVADEMVVKASAHEDLWSGLSRAAKKPAQLGLKETDFTEAPRLEFNKTMMAYSSELVDFVQAGVHLNLLDFHAHCSTFVQVIGPVHNLD